MNRKSSLYIYIKSTKGWRYSKPAYSERGKLIPQTAVVGGVNESHPEGKYFLSLGGKWVPAGDNAKDAVERLELLNSELDYKARGGRIVAAVAETKVSAAPKKGVTLEEAQRAYIAHIDLQVRAQKLKARTLSSAEGITTEFVKWVGKNTKRVFVHQITTSDVDEYVAWAIGESPTKSTRTGANKYIRVGQFLKHAGCVDITSSKDAPRYSKDAPVRVYSPEELDTFFAACTGVQALIYRTFLKTGLRDMELVTLERADVDAVKGCLHITAKTHWGFTPKTWESRQVWIDDETLADLLAHLKTHAHRLVFPTSTGQPNYKLLRCLKRIVKRAGLDPEQWWLHAFRSTYATTLLRDGLGIPEVQRLLGHSHGSKSIWRYVRAVEGEQLRDKLNEIRTRKSPPNSPVPSNVLQMRA